MQSISCAARAMNNLRLIFFRRDRILEALHSGLDRKSVCQNASFSVNATAAGAGFSD
jgi:hypothetical protein